MAATLVCTANTGVRFDCDNRCRRCRHLIPDRRERQVSAYLDSYPERRSYSNWIPAARRTAGGSRRAAESTGQMLPLVLAVALVAFNLLDAFLTTRALSMGVSEGNPLMAGLFSLSLPAAMMIKTVIVAAGVICLWWFWHISLARRGLMMLTGFYGAVILYHLVFQFLLLP